MGRGGGGVAGKRKKTKRGVTREAASSAKMATNHSINYRRKMVQKGTEDIIRRNN